MKTIIHVNQHKVRARHASPLTVKTYKSNQEAATAKIVVGGEVVARIVYRPNDPISCGARVWIETNEEVRVTSGLHCTHRRDTLYLQENSRTQPGVRAERP